MKKLLATFKEEFVIYPLLIALFYLINWGLSAAFPDGAFFDFFSVIETLYFGLLKTAIGIAIGMLLFRVSFPQAFKQMIHYYHNFSSLTEFEKKIITLILAILFLILPALSSRAQATMTRSNLIKSLATQINVRETGYNTGPEVDLYLKSVGFSPGASWCGAFVGYNLTRLGIKNPNSAWSPAYANPKDVIWTPKNPRTKPLPGDVPTFWNARLNRVGHVGFFIRTDPDGYFITEEGNTNKAGSFNGDGVYFKKHPPNKIHAISRFIK